MAMKTPAQREQQEKALKKWPSTVTATAIRTMSTLMNKRVGKSLAAPAKAKEK